ncbi:novel plant SNARE 11-like [Camellia sinensis]|uniref:novel plant SNARE 11-like n=1 Tax=Camellia sinensis TaxID=4442 RepID=UPI001035914E|nr:novel plant SNARE 11-like [Camellia sinensis]
MNRAKTSQSGFGSYSSFHQEYVECGPCRAMTNQELIDNGNRTMDEADQAIDRSKKVVHDTINVGTDRAAALKAQLHC